MNPTAAYSLMLGDDALVLSHRLTEWVTRAPQLEEDMAIANIALDLLGQARSLLTYAGEVEGAGRTEDDLAYFRDEREFHNVQLVELPRGDFAETMARLLVFSSYQVELYSRLSACDDATLAGIAGKALKEVGYHRDHATQWALRLGDGTDESHRRMQAGLEAIWPYVGELFEPLPAAVREIAVDPTTLREPWTAYVEGVLTEVTLAAPDDTGHRATGGRRGIHTEALGYLLAEMQHLARSHPGAAW